MGVGWRCGRQRERGLTPFAGVWAVVAGDRMRLEHVLVLDVMVLEVFYDFFDLVRDCQ